MYDYIFGALDEPMEVITYPASIDGNNLPRKIAHVLWKFGIFIKWNFFGKEFNDFIAHFSSKDKVVFFACFPEPVMNLIPWLPSRKMASVWLWDTLDNRPVFCTKLPELKKLNIPICTFDPDDASHYNIRYVPQVYNMQHPRNLDSGNAVIDFCDCYYIGHLTTSYRRKMIQDISTVLNAQGISFVKYLVDGKNVKFISYVQNLDNLSKCKAIIELNVEGQTGPTLRAMEALSFRKKLITNNAHIKHFDFYRKENIFIFGEDDPATLRSFVDSPYQEVPDEIIMRYDVNEWIKNIF